MDSLSSVRRALWFYGKDFHARRVVVDVKTGKQFLQAAMQLSLGAGAATGSVFVRGRLRVSDPAASFIPGSNNLLGPRLARTR